ncbi:uncharacterized protein JCM15063_001587 [Sporobolomyces koalae]|uniref:uncharacterized protein n=1 Tax=Sporobolomyces koalae TaxID=500713 RepID=UPI00317FB59D
MNTLDDIPDNEWVDCKAAFDAALSDLAIGQLVQDPRYSMMDLMSAIEINDPRTDSYVSARQHTRTHLPEFDPSRTLDAREVLWVVDELMRLEATFQDGQPLMSTLWNCNYFRIPSLTLLASTCSQRPVDSIQDVLRAMLLAILKTQEIVWEECCKGQVYEHEDVHLASSTLSFDSLMAACYPRSGTHSPSPPPSPNPLLVSGQEGAAAAPPRDRKISIDDVLKLLDEASNWLKSQASTNQTSIEDLTLRVMLRTDLLYTLALLTFPAHTTPSQIQNHLGRMSSYLARLPTAATGSTASDFSPPPYLESIFSPSHSVPLLATSQPPRLIDPIPLGESYDKFVRHLVAELKGLCEVWDGWRSEKMGYKQVKEYSRMMARREVSPYLRSVHQTVLASTPSHVFSVSPLIHLATSFLSTLASIPTSFFLIEMYELHQTESDYSAPAHVAFAWLEKLAQELLRTSLPLAGQNRTRQFRWIRKSISTWIEFLAETRTILPGLESMTDADDTVLKNRIESIEMVVRTSLLDLILENVCSGFENVMELYRSEEWDRVWFVVREIARELELCWKDLRDHADREQKGYLEARRAEANAIGQMARASIILSILFPSPKTKHSSPFLASVVLDQNKVDRGRYAQRFDWIRAGESGTIVKSRIGFDTYSVNLEELRSRDRSSLAQEGTLALNQAVSALTAMGTVPLAERGCSVRPEFALRNLASLRRTAFANQQKLASVQDSPVSETPSFKWDHPWFPTWL